MLAKSTKLKIISEIAQAIPLQQKGGSQLASLRNSARLRWHNIQASIDNQSKKTYAPKPSRSESIRRKQTMESAQTKDLIASAILKIIDEPAPVIDRELEFFCDQLDIDFFGTQLEKTLGGKTDIPNPKVLQCLPETEQEKAYSNTGGYGLPAP